MATKQDVQDALNTASALLAAVPTSVYTPLVRPTPSDCLGGTIPNLITIPVGDSTPGGEMIEPYRTRRMDNMPSGIVGIFGDSILQATHETLVSPFGVNFALGGQSLRRLVNSLRYGFPCMDTAGAGVILCGVNDLGNTTYYGARNATSPDNAAATVVGMYSNQLKNYLTGKWVICHLLPCNEGVTGAYGYNAQVAYVNANIQAAMAGCAATLAFVPVNPEFVDASGQLKAIYHIGDGQHLNKAGSALLAAGINQALVSLGIQ